MTRPGQPVDGRPYVNPAVIARHETYNEQVLLAHRTHDRDTALLVPVPAVPVREPLPVWRTDAADPNA